MTKTNLGLMAKTQLINRFLGKKVGAGGTASVLPASRGMSRSTVPEAFCRFDRHPGYEKMLVPKAAVVERERKAEEAYEDWIRQQRDRAYGRGEGLDE